MQQIICHAKPIEELKNRFWQHFIFVFVLCLKVLVQYTATVWGLEMGGLWATGSMLSIILYSGIKSLRKFIPYILRALVKVSDTFSSIMTLLF